MKAKIERVRFLTASEKFECRLLLEIHNLVKAANQESDLHERLARLQKIADMLESLGRINPEMDVAFWSEWISARLDAVEEQIADLYDEGEG